MDRNLIIPILQRLEDLGPLDPDTRNEKEAARYQRYYVEGLHGGHGDAVNQLALDIEVSSGGRNAHLFSGTIGSGKSTELRRMAEHLRQRGHFAAVANARDYLNPQIEISISELLLAMALAVWELTATAQGKSPTDGQRWEWWKSLFASGVELESVEIPTDLVTAKFALVSNPTVRERIRRYHEQSLDRLVTEVHAFFEECAEALRSMRDPVAKCVLVLDSLEHFGGTAVPGEPDVVFNSLQRMFNTHARHLQLPGWTVVYSVPPLLGKLSPGIASAWSMSRTYALTSAHVFKDRSNDPDEDTINQKLLPLVQKRIGEEWAQLLTANQLRLLVEKTGGDLRDLLRCTRAALLKGLMNTTFPVTDDSLEEAFSDLRRPYLPLSQASRDRLQIVARDFEVDQLLQDDRQWPVVMSDLAQKRILMYLNGQEWYGVHPLLRDVLKPEAPAVG
ncbi:hypothetical protein Y695_01083 [Hydrogenophaga sp. T4]|nr:hypothetical protein Y695_01083 [Hydrogenophaga sp. T4]